MVKQNANKKLGGVVVGVEEKISTCRAYYRLREIPLSLKNEEQELKA
jgi:hypothetical protein